MNFELPEKKPAAPAGVTCMSSASRLGSLGPEVMSCNLRSEKTGTWTNCRTLVSTGRRGAGSSESLRLTENVGASPGRRLPAGLYGFGSVKTGAPYKSRPGTWQDAHLILVKSCSPVSTACSTAKSLGITRPGTANDAW